MTETTQSTTLVSYPESDAQPMSESDPTRDYLLYSVEALEGYFRGRPNVYVSGNLFIYYREGDAKCSISPDVFVIFGVSKRKRRSYKTWQEGGKLPSFILEITSLTTKKQDEVEKPILYASLGVQEYFQYDPTGDYLNPQLKGAHLVNGSYHPLPLQTVEGISFIHSQVLGLDLSLQPPTNQSFTIPQPVPVPLELRFRDPQTRTKLLSYRELEQAKEQAEADRALAQQAKEQAEQALEMAVSRLLTLGLTPEQVADALNVPIEAVRIAQLTPDT
jgi:Uma2 family endonuclease